MRWSIVHACKNNILETDPTLVRKIVTFQLSDHLFNRIFAFDRHHRKTLIMNRIVQTHGQMCRTAVQKLSHRRNHTNR